MPDRGAQSTHSSRRSYRVVRSLPTVWCCTNNIFASFTFLDVYLLSFVVQLVSSPFSEGITPNVAIDWVCLWERVSSNVTTPPFWTPLSSIFPFTFNLLSF